MAEREPERDFFAPAAADAAAEPGLAISDAAEVVDAGAEDAGAGADDAVEEAGSSLVCALGRRAPERDFFGALGAAPDFVSADSTKPADALGLLAGATD